VSYSKTPAKILTIKGNVTLIVDDALGTGDVTMENSKVIIESGGSLDLYVKQTLTLRGTTIINPPCRLVASPCADPSPATAVRILGISTTVLNFVGASVTYGGVNAPGAEFNLQSESQLYGTVVARIIAMSGAKSGSGIHVDKGFSGTSDVGNIVY
ncbi:MAG TPA: hypothetical protein PKZ12_06910, partial [Smithellaceae bacterium]|nr:hypothetical protein [Smithellaceae bacterium]